MYLYVILCHMSDLVIYDIIRFVFTFIFPTFHLFTSSNLSLFTSLSHWLKMNYLSIQRTLPDYSSILICTQAAAARCSFSSVAASLSTCLFHQLRIWRIHKCNTLLYLWYTHLFWIAPLNTLHIETILFTLLLQQVIFSAIYNSNIPAQSLSHHSSIHLICVHPHSQHSTCSYKLQSKTKREAWYHTNTLVCSEW